MAHVSCQSFLLGTSVIVFLDTAMFSSVFAGALQHHIAKEFKGLDQYEAQLSRLKQAFSNAKRQRTKQQVPYVKTLTDRTMAQRATNTTDEYTFIKGKQHPARYSYRIRPLHKRTLRGQHRRINRAVTQVNKPNMSGTVNLPNMPGTFNLPHMPETVKEGKHRHKLAAPGPTCVDVKMGAGAKIRLPCKYLVEEHFYWKFNKPHIAKEKCEEGKYTNCCATCKMMGYNRLNEPTVATATEIPDSKGQHTEIPDSKGQHKEIPDSKGQHKEIPDSKGQQNNGGTKATTERPDDNCKDDSILYAGIEIDCIYLTKDSFRDLNSFPEQKRRCAGDKDTKCCKTCRKLGFRSTDDDTLLGNTCSSNPCQNGGHCFIKTGLRHKCACTNYFGGKNCEKEIDRCDVMGCTEITRCMFYLNKALCLCKTPEYNYKFCSTTSAGHITIASIESLATEVTTESGIVICFFAALAILAFYLCCHCVRVKAKRHKLKEAYKESLKQGEVHGDLPPNFMTLSTSMCCFRSGEPGKSVDTVSRKKSVTNKFGTSKSGTEISGTNEKTSKKNNKKKKKDKKSKKKKKKKSKTSDENVNQTSNSLRRIRFHGDSSCCNTDDDNENANTQKGYYNNIITRRMQKFYAHPDHKSQPFVENYREMANLDIYPDEPRRALKSHSDYRILHNGQFSNNRKTRQECTCVPMLVTSKTKAQVDLDLYQKQRHQLTCDFYDPVAVMSLFLSDDTGSETGSDSERDTISGEETIYSRRG